MRRTDVGRYAVSVAGNESVRAFVPAPLPPAPPLHLEGAVRDALDQALLALGRLDGAAATLPDVKLLLYTYQRKEAVLSSQIRGPIHAGRPSCSCARRGSGRAARRCRRGFPRRSRDDPRLAALARGLPTVESAAQGNARRSVGERARCQKTPGEFRRSQNWMAERAQGAVFVPPPPQDVEQCMSDLERFLHSRRLRW